MKSTYFTNYEKQRLQKASPREAQSAGQRGKISNALQKKMKQPFVMKTISTDKSPRDFNYTTATLPTDRKWLPGIHGDNIL